MITANEAYKMAKSYLNGIGKKSFDKLAGEIDFCITCEADTGHREHA